VAEDLPGLQRGDYLLVDRGVQFVHDGDYVAIEEHDGIAVRIQKGGPLHLAQNKPAPIWGVGVAVIRQLRNQSA